MSKVRLPAALLTAVLMWVALAAWAFMSPVGAAPDDDYHLAMVYCAAGEAECVLEGQREGPCFTMRPEVPAECSDWGARTIPETEGIATDHYPPFYYLAMAPLVGQTLAETTIAMRLANVTLAVAMMVGALALSAPALRRSMTWSWLLAAVPMGVYFIASMNPSAWVIIGFAALWGPLLTHLTATGGAGASWASPVSTATRTMRVLFVLLASLIALAGRTEGALFLPLVATALAVFALPRRRSVGHAAAWRPLVLPGVLVALSALFLWLFARPKAGNLAGGVDIGQQTYRGWEVVQHTVNSLLGTLGMPGVPGASLGTYDVPVPALAAALTVGALIAAAIWGLSTMYGRKALSLTLLASAGFTLTAVLWSRETWVYFQPRYFVPLSVVLVGLVLLPAAENTPGATRTSRLGLVLPMTLIAVSVSNSLAMLSTIQRFIRGVRPQPSRDPLTQQAPALDPSELAYGADPPWWWNSLPLDPFSVWVLGSAAFAAAAAVIWWLLRDERPATSTRPAHTASVQH